MALLAGKTAVITGGSSGIGLATARRFVEEGATVFIFSRRPTELEAAVATLGPAATAVYGDVTGSADLQKLRAIVAATGNGADIIFANTGIAGAAPLGEISHAHFHDLRHYLASLLIASGADIKTVQARMRHASARTTLDTYGDLWPDADESTRSASVR